MLGPMEIVLIVVGVLLALGVGLFCGYLYRKRVAERRSPRQRMPYTG